MAHIGDRPGLDPATIAPLGAVVQARVLEVEIEKRRLTLTMRSDREEGYRRGGDRRPERGERGPDRGLRRGGDRGGRGDRRPEGPRRDDRRGAGGGHPGGRPRPAPAPAEATAEAARHEGAAAKPGGKPGGKGGKKGKFQVQELGLFDRKRFRDEPGTPRRISLKSEDLTPEQILARKLAELRDKAP
jgi:hypothetical protein